MRETEQGQWPDPTEAPHCLSSCCSPAQAASPFSFSALLLDSRPLSISFLPILRVPDGVPSPQLIFRGSSWEMRQSLARELAE